MSIDARTSLGLQLAEQLRDMQHRSTDAMFTSLDEIMAGAVGVVPGADHAGITVVDHTGSVRTVSPTHRYPALLDKLQETHGEGPCVAAASKHDMMRIDDLNTDRRWPRYAQDALAQTPIRSVLSFGLFKDKTAMGALNFYAERSVAFSEESVEVGLIYATHTAIAWDVLRVSGEFRVALASRDIIGQAKGMLMERFGVDAARAFELLKKLSQESNTRLVSVAERVVNADRRVDEHIAPY